VTSSPTKLEEYSPSRKPTHRGGKSGSEEHGSELKNWDVFVAYKASFGYVLA